MPKFSDLLKLVPGAVHTVQEIVAEVQTELAHQPATVSAPVEVAPPSPGPVVAEVVNSDPTFTKAQLAAACPALTGTRLDTMYPFIVKHMAKYGITTQKQIAAFLATCGHESVDFTTFSENLNYSAQALLATFGKYFTPALAEQYARNPQAIGNRVYANRMGNGDERSGDGYMFRGGGGIQITGRKGVGAFALALQMPLDQANAYLRTPEGAVEASCWFWSANGLNRYVDNFVGLQGLVNVGRLTATEAQINGINDRKARFSRACKALGV